MKSRVLTLLLASSAVVLSYVILLVGNHVQRFFQIGYQATSAEASNLMPAPTRFASQYAWGFALAVLLFFIIAAVCSRRYPASNIQIVTAGLCGQGAVVWVAMFCFCYSGFCGPMTLHRGPAFDLGEFLGFEEAVFPITLAALLIPVFASCGGREKLKSNAE